MFKIILAILATACIISSYIPQIIKGYKTKSLRDISFGFLGILSVGGTLWAIYGFVDQDYLFFSANVVITFFVLVLMIMKFAYERKE